MGKRRRNSFRRSYKKPSNLGERRGAKAYPLGEAIWEN